MKYKRYAVIDIITNELIDMVSKHSDALTAISHDINACEYNYGEFEKRYVIYKVHYGVAVSDIKTYPIVERDIE